jgi:hypothetical protein
VLSSVDVPDVADVAVNKFPFASTNPHDAICASNSSYSKSHVPNAVVEHRSARALGPSPTARTNARTFTQSSSANAPVVAHVAMSQLRQSRTVVASIVGPKTKTQRLQSSTRASFTAQQNTNTQSSHPCAKNVDTYADRSIAIVSDFRHLYATSRETPSGSARNDGLRRAIGASVSTDVGDGGRAVFDAGDAEDMILATTALGDGVAAQSAAVGLAK